VALYSYGREDDDVARLPRLPSVPAVELTAAPPSPSPADRGTSVGRMPAHAEGSFPGPPGLVRVAENMRRAMEPRATIGQAKGVLMER
jgi:hypothetical protein